MPLTSDDWPRHSFHAGPTTAHAEPRSAEIASRLAAALASDPAGRTCECWLQLRPAKRAADGNDDDATAVPDGCWLLHAPPSWAIGITSDGHVCVYVDGGRWFRSHGDAPIHPRRWHHLAVVVVANGPSEDTACSGGPCTPGPPTVQLLVDGAVVGLGPLTKAVADLPVAPTAGIRVGWAPREIATSHLVLYELRLWAVAIDATIINEWFKRSITAQHAQGDALIAHWPLESGTATDVEFDQSAHCHDLRLVKKEGNVCWMRITPRHFQPTRPGALCLRNHRHHATDGQKCDFVLEVLPSSCDFDAVRPQRRGIILLVLNIMILKSPTLTSEGKGRSTITLLKALVESLPEQSVLAIAVIRTSDNLDAGHGPLSFPPTVLSEEGKVAFRRFIDHIAIRQVLPSIELVDGIVLCMRSETFRQQLRSSRSVCTLTTTTIIVLSEHKENDSNDEWLKLNDELLPCARLRTETHVLHLTGRQHRSFPSKGTTLYQMPADDLEWVLSLVALRVQDLIAAEVEIQFFSVDDAMVMLRDDSQPTTFKLDVSAGCEFSFPIHNCSVYDRTIVSGSFLTGSSCRSRSPVAEVALVYWISDGERRVARTSLRLLGDITDEINVERAARNKTLRITEDTRLLLEQRHQLMKRKNTYISGFLEEEVAELENSFKKVNIMKEELWAKKSWISERGLRLHEESEIQILKKEVKTYCDTFQERMGILQIGATATAREASRGTSRGNSRDASQAVYFRPRTGGSANNAPDIEEIESQVHKLALKTDLQAKQLHEHSVKMDELCLSIKLAETRGSVIMNDVRRSWIVRLQDVFQTRHGLQSLLLARETLELEKEYHTESKHVWDVIEGEIQSLRSLFTQHEKEHLRRRKRTQLYIREVSGSMKDEFQSAINVEKSKHALREARLLKSLVLTPDMEASCVYVCFPSDLVQMEFPTPQSRILTSFVHASLFGLRNFCDEHSQAPISKRIGFNECFLWWGVEQNPIFEASTMMDIVQTRRQVSRNAWAMILILYNELFSSVTAVSMIKESLIEAKQNAKPIIVIELENPINSLEEFRAKWSVRKDPDKSPNQIPPVEKEYLVWRQQFMAVRGILASYQQDQLALFQYRVNPLQWMPCTDCTTELASRRQPDVKNDFMCLSCVWPFISSTQLARNAERIPGMLEFTSLLTEVAERLDEATSSILQSAPRTYNINPTELSPYSEMWRRHLEKEFHAKCNMWEDSFCRRWKEIERQKNKMFKIYEEEARDVVGLRYSIRKRREEVISNMRAQLQTLGEEKKLAQTMLEIHFAEEKRDIAQRSREREHMIIEELDQALGTADILLDAVESLEENETAYEDIATVKKEFELALFRSNRTILGLGHIRMEDHQRRMTKSFRTQQLKATIEHIERKHLELQCQISHAEANFDEALVAADRICRDRELTILEDAKAFFRSSSMEVFIHSLSTDVVDLTQLQKLARDVNHHAAAWVNAMVEGLRCQLEVSTAIKFREAVSEAINHFRMHFSPSIDEHHTSHESTTRDDIKDYCLVNSDNPGSTWQSLSDMNAIVDSEVFSVRATQQLQAQWKQDFLHQLSREHLSTWWATCRSLWLHLHSLTTEFATAKEDSFVDQKKTEAVFRDTVTQQELYQHRATVLVRRLIETRQRQTHLLKLLQTARECYGTAVTTTETLQNYKMDPVYKNWFQFGDYHVGLIGQLFDLRSKCAQELECVEQELAELSKKSAQLVGDVESAHLQWMKASIRDFQVCERSNRLQGLVHNAVELVLQLEASRVSSLVRSLDLRKAWLTESYVKEWWGQHAEAQISETDRDHHGQQLGVDDHLVQLSIARLDVIKQRRWRDDLQRRTIVFEVIKGQEMEKRQIVEEEMLKYRSLGETLRQRVDFIRKRCDACRESPYINRKSSFANGSHDPVHAFTIVTTSTKELEAFIVSAHKEYLSTEATACQLAWRMQQHAASTSRVQRILDDIFQDIRRVDDYLDALIDKDHDLYCLGVKQSSTGIAQVDVADASTIVGGVDIDVCRAVLDFYSRDQWFRRCLDATTAIGEEIRKLRNHVVQLRSTKRQTTVRGELDRETVDSDGAMDVEVMAGNDESIAAVEDELCRYELSLLFNRYESRIAEKSSESLRGGLHQVVSSKEDCIAFDAIARPLDDINIVFPSEQLHSWLFNRQLWEAEREKMLLVLRQVTTQPDPRDNSGNVSETIFGASLDRHDANHIFMIKSKAYVDEQWGIVYVVLFFARLFRRAALHKAARQRQLSDSANALLVIKNLETVHRDAQAIMRWSESLAVPPTLSPCFGDLKNHLCLHIRESGECGFLARIAAGLLTDRPMHCLLQPYFPQAAAEIRGLANKFERARELAESKPPKPTDLDVVRVDGYSIKIQWQPVPNDHDLVYVAEITEHFELDTDTLETRIHWEQELCAEKSAHVFHKLHPGTSYWVRVRSGFSRTRLGEPTHPILVRLPGS